MTFYPKGYKLSDRQIKFCKYYLSNGFKAEKAALEAGYTKVSAKQADKLLLTNPNVKRYLQPFITKAVVKLKAEDKEVESIFDKTLRKLQKVINKGIPDDIEDQERMDVDGVRVALSAISEQNKMLGHLAPTKSQNVNVNVSSDNAKQIMQRLVDENKNPY